MIGSVLAEPCPVRQLLWLAVVKNRALVWASQVQCKWSMRRALSRLHPNSTNSMEKFRAVAINYCTFLNHSRRSWLLSFSEPIGISGSHWKSDQPSSVVNEGCTHKLKTETVDRAHA